MGTGAEAVAIPLLLSGAAAGATVYNERSAANRADRIAAQGIRQQGLRQREANARVDQQLANVEKANPAADQQAQNTAYLEQLRRSRAAALGGGGVPGASSRYVSDAADADSAVSTTAARIADLMSRVDAPALQREREAQQVGRLQSDLGVIGRNAAGDDFLNRLRLRAVRANPWVNAAAGVLQGYANARAIGTTPAGAGGFGGEIENPLIFPSSANRRLPEFGTRLV